jgi:hypothetical protein
MDGDLEANAGAPDSNNDQLFRTSGPSWR